MRDPSTPRASENAVLLAACRVGAAPALPSLASTLDWDYIARAADRQGVAPLLHDALARAGVTDVPDARARHFYHAYWANHFRSRLLLAELARVVDAAAAAGIVVAPLKGAALVETCYPAPALRPMSDLDLLIQPRDLEAMHALLRRLGYRQTEPEPSYVGARWLDDRSREYCWVISRDGVEVLVEYRTEPFEPSVGRLTDLDPAFTEAIGREAAVLWSRACGAGGGARAPRLSPEDLLLHVAIHLAAKHADFRLIWLHDLARLAAHEVPLDWDDVAKKAAALRVGAPVGAALDAAARWMSAPIPRAARERVRGPGRASALERWERRRLGDLVASIGDRDLTVGGPAVWPLGSALNRLRGWRPRLRALRWVTAPSRAYLAHRGLVADGPLGYWRACLGRYADRSSHAASRAARGEASS